ncbi:MAG: aromatic ring-hydroxylating dioxygenase subunit alpha [Okeania sp. SIO3I5]|uniref:aromatic ring-hydroxylating oxygenase subunit alpha n=1 Tax=Okeania sp. SIO3I5 TaxID=2607805 RepID=UPI0013BE1866|nr:aromatic ring-hydroxylating dioxygenase subunit alpha [Okeania sp. SIO3I5]NEQ40548.1 aromatic ring-hydroxylating dioxygenase subunit alpha [Okeania sp. SIO3I5]
MTSSKEIDSKVASAKSNLSSKNLSREEIETVQDILKTDSRPVPPVLKQESTKNLGNLDIPKERYFSQEYHDQEVEKLWKKVWQWACREENIPNVGDYVVYEIADLSVIVIRTKPNKISAFYNSCLHRGMQLCVGEGKTSNLRCPYHGWTWKLDGTLAHIPCRWDFEHVNDNDFRLPEVKVDTWQGFVFINFDPNCESLENYLENIPEHFQQFAFPLEKRFTALHVAQVINTNWKVALEAMMEAYHIFATHPQMLKHAGDINSKYNIYGRHSYMVFPSAMQSPYLGKPQDPQAPAKAMMDYMGIDRDIKLTSKGMNSRAYAAEAVRQNLNQHLGVDLSDVSDTEMIDAISYFVFPNSIIMPVVGQPAQLRFRPYGNNPDFCIMDLLTLLPSSLENTPPPAKTRWLTSEEKWSDVPEIQPEEVGVVLDQDFANLPLIQKGLKTSAKPGITLANYQESRIRHFHLVLDKYLSD